MAFSACETYFPRSLRVLRLPLQWHGQVLLLLFLVMSGDRLHTLSLRALALFSSFARSPYYKGYVFLKK